MMMMMMMMMITMMIMIIIIIIILCCDYELGGLEKQGFEILPRISLDVSKTRAIAPITVNLHSGRKEPEILKN